MVMVDPFKYSSGAQIMIFVLSAGLVPIPITGYLCKHDIHAIMRVKLKSHKYNSHNLYLQSDTCSNTPA